MFIRRRWSENCRCPFYRGWNYFFWFSFLYFTALIVGFVFAFCLCFPYALISAGALFNREKYKTVPLDSHNTTTKMHSRVCELLRIFCEWYSPSSSDVRSEQSCTVTHFQSLTRVTPEHFLPWFTYYLANTCFLTLYISYSSHVENKSEERFKI